MTKKERRIVSHSSSLSVTIEAAESSKHASIMFLCDRNICKLISYLFHSLFIIQFPSTSDIVKTMLTDCFFSRLTRGAGSLLSIVFALVSERSCIISTTMKGRIIQ
jgi:hypothetical protein